MNIKQMIEARIKEIRVKRKLTQEQLAEKTEINPKYLSSIERGLENPTFNTFFKLSESMDVSLDDIFNQVQIEDPAERKSMINSLLDQADDEQLKLAYRILSVIIN